MTRATAKASPQGRPAISLAKFAALCRLAELVASRVPHLFNLESGEAYLCLCRALRDAIFDAFEGPNDNLFILETYRQMLPKYVEFEPWHHSEREKRKGSAESPLPEGVARCARCVHTNTIHGDGACAYIPCECAVFVGASDFRARVVQAAVEGDVKGWDGS